MSNSQPLEQEQTTDSGAALNWTIDPEDENINCTDAPGKIVMYDPEAENPDEWIAATMGSYTTAAGAR